MHVVQAELLRVLGDLDASPPRVLDERQLEQARGIAHRLEDPGAAGL